MDNRGVAFLVFLSIEKGIFFHILSYIFAIKCQIPVVEESKICHLVMG